MAAGKSCRRWAASRPAQSTMEIVPAVAKHRQTAYRRSRYAGSVGCASSIMLSNVQFVLKAIDDDSVTRMFPGIEGMEVTYHRCKI